MKMEYVANPNKQNYRSIVIIGNGFDIAHKLKTSYEDFRKSLTGDPLECDFCRLLKKHLGSANLWTDFEEAIKEMTLAVFYQYSMVASVDNERQLEKINDLFKELTNRLLDYLIEETTAKKVNKLQSVKKFIKRKAKVLTFNYTSTAENYSHNITYIHGSLAENDIVLGYDYRPEPCLMWYNAMRWSKLICRDRLAFGRYLKTLQIKPDTDEFINSTNAMEQILKFENSGRGLMDSDWEDIKNSAHFENYRKLKQLHLNGSIENICWCKIRQIVIMGHGIKADREFLRTILSKCRRLKKIVVFSYEEEKENEWKEKENFLKPFCKKIKKVYYK